MCVKISIIMGIFNCADTLPEAIESILAQTETDWELIMCDDGSKDNTFAVAQSYAEQYPRKITVIQNKQNLGLNATLNNCLEYATGKYIARMDGDDISLPDRLKKEADFLDVHPEYAIVSTPMIMFDETGDWGRSRPPIEKPEIADFVFHTPFHCHAPCMIRREAYMAVGGYTVDPKLLRFEDCNLWFKLYGKGYRGYNLSDPLYKMRDDKNAIARRKFSYRMRGVYVKYTGFKLVNMPLKYYPTLALEFLKCLILGLCPTGTYKKLHQMRHS